MEWSEFLRHLKPREDLDELFPIETFEYTDPVFVPANELIAAGVVGARVLEIIATRGGTRLDPSDFGELRRTLLEALPEDLGALLDDEARRVLSWLDHKLDEDAVPEGAGGVTDEADSEVDVMLEADFESRISLLEFAMAEEYDLELEHYHEPSDTWPRIRCTPLSLIDVDTEDGDTPPRLEVDVYGQTFVIPLKHIRWLMPVARKDTSGVQGVRQQPGEVIQFPGGESDREEDEDE